MVRNKNKSPAVKSVGGKEHNARQNKHKCNFYCKQKLIERGDIEKYKNVVLCHAKKQS